MESGSRTGPRVAAPGCSLARTFLVGAPSSGEQGGAAETDAFRGLAGGFGRGRDRRPGMAGVGASSPAGSAVAERRRFGSCSVAGERRRRKNYFCPWLPCFGSSLYGRFRRSI